MCVDYQALNKVTIKNKYPIPNAMDLFDKLKKARYYTKIDLRSGYWQVRVARGDESKITCVTRRFIKGYPKIVNPLTDLLKKDQKWEWTVACDDAFKLLKQVISTRPVQQLPQFDRLFEVQVDASDRALGGVLVQDKHPVAFECRKHNDVADALSRKMVEEYVAALKVVESDLLDQIRESSKMDAGPLRRRLLRETHDPEWAGHPGIDRMLALLGRRYYWLRMEEDVEAYVRTCLVCQLNKVERKKEVRLLQPLPIPEGPWQSVSMDFITGVPKVKGMASILVVVDRFSKYGISIAPPNACPAETAAELFFKHVTKYFGMPRDIISDRDTRFTERFWMAMFNMMGTELKFSAANHPQIDGQTERMKKYADKGRRHVGFNVGDQVLLKLTPQIWKKISSKTVHHGLIPKYDGYFKVVSKVGSLAYRLKLPDRLKIHPTFHLSFLKKFHQDLLDKVRQQIRRAPPVIRKEFQKTVLKSLDHRTMGQNMRIRPPNVAGMVIHSVGQSGRLGRARAGLPRMSCGLCADGCGYVRKTLDRCAKHSAKTGRTVSTACAQWPANARRRVGRSRLHVHSGQPMRAGLGSSAQSWPARMVARQLWTVEANLVDWWEAVLGDNCRPPGTDLEVAVV
ncbi:UNVERIFIED_CONTAM: Transposon Ty3-G Gag-Pol polyprotein [Sesamum radiatum]|uniref:Transposon Ty3-G Gag-Pol polyprotein n=1 Tax=Sesamum radiatum TaxID=300843 RepID=A0AAW2L2S6_SESRA